MTHESLFTFLPMKMEQIECSETSAYKILALLFPSYPVIALAAKNIDRFYSET
jgi:hypothetical protein